MKTKKVVESLDVQAKIRTMLCAEMQKHGDNLETLSKKCGASKSWFLLCFAGKNRFGRMTIEQITGVYPDVGTWVVFAEHGSIGERGSIIGLTRAGAARHMKVKREDAAAMAGNRAA